MEWLAGCLSLKADRQVLTPTLETAQPHINQNEHVFLMPMESVLVQWRRWGQGVLADGQRPMTY